VKPMSSFKEFTKPNKKSNFDTKAGQNLRRRRREERGRGNDIQYTLSACCSYSTVLTAQQTHAYAGDDFFSLSLDHGVWCWPPRVAEVSDGASFSMVDG